MEARSMSDRIKGDQWVWVVVQDPGGNEQFLGQHDQEKDLSFIPAFLGKEEAQECLPRIPQEKGHSYEIQAIEFDDLRRRAAESGFMVFILNGAGRVLERIEP
jgi:hypothetical protein